MPIIKKDPTRKWSNIGSLRGRKFLPLAALCLLLTFLALHRILAAGIPWTPDDPSFILHVDYLTKYGLTQWSHWWYGGFPLFTYNGPLPVVVPWLFIKIFHTDVILGYKIAEAIFIIAAALVAGSTIWAILITMGHAENWSFVLDLGRYAFYCLVSGLILVIIRHIRNEAGRSAKSEDKSATE